MMVTTPSTRDCTCRDGFIGIILLGVNASEILKCRRGDVTNNMPCKSGKNSGTSVVKKPTFL